MSRNRLPLVSGLILLLVVAVLFLGWGIYRKSRFDSSSQELAIATTQSIFSSNSAAALVASAHGDLLAQMPAESLNSYLTSVQRILGTLDTLETIAGASDVSLMPISTTAPTASYEIELVFAGQSATAVMEMIYEQGAWRFIEYSIQSDLLLN